MMLHIQNLKYDAMNLFMKQKQTQTQKASLWLPKGKEWGGHKLGVWDQQIQTIIYIIHK